MDPPTPPPTSGVARAEAGYWTAQRLESAVPVTLAPSGVSRALSSQPPPQGLPGGKFFAGVRTVGTFFVAQASGATSCTGSVVHSEGRDLVLTAGHCARSWGMNPVHRIFVPQYTSGRSASDQPYGFFPVLEMYTDPRYDSTKRTAATTDLDFSFARTGPDSSGRLVEDVTGALTLKTTPSYRNTVTVIGYPGVAHNPRQQALTCTVPTYRLPGGYRQMEMLCRGYYNGTSGGPWIANLNTKTGAGDVIGLIGGRGAGGDDNNDDWVSYSPYFNDNITDLYADAAADKHTSRPAYQPETDTDLLPGGVAVWKNARLTASGDYNGAGRSDLLVVWADGRVSMFPSDGTGGFLPERTLLAANPRWRTARLVTSGDFDGSDHFDLMVVWGNGAVSSFRDVSPNGLGAERAFAKAGGKWGSAAQIAAGRFGGSSYVSDLLVRWASGEVTLYTGVGGGSFGQAHRLHKAGALWKSATLLTSGQYTGSGTWDLFVRWSDGELDSYPRTTARGLGAEKRIQNPNDVWTRVAVMTTGRYTKNNLVDDLIIRWSDGRVSMYADSRQRVLGARRPLVSR